MIIYILSMSLFVWMMCYEFGESFNKHLSRCCAKSGADTGSQKSMIRKWLHSEITQGLIEYKNNEQTSRYCFLKQRKSLRLTVYKIGSSSLSFFSVAKKEEVKITFIFTWNLHQESLSASYSTWHHLKDEFLLFKMMCHLSQKPLLLRVLVQRKLHTLQISTVYHVYMLSNMCVRKIQNDFHSEDLECNLDKFSVLAIAKSLSDLTITVFWCSWHLFKCSRSDFVVCQSQFEQHYKIIFSWISVRYIKLLCM